MGERLNGIQEVRGSTPLISTNRMKRTQKCSFFLYRLMRGLHNHVVRNCVAVKPLRAGVHSFVQAHSFHYYADFRLRPPPSSPPKINVEWDTFCIYFLSKSQTWHIITLQRVYHRRRRISSPKVYSLRLDDMPLFEWMICNFLRN